MVGWSLILLMLGVVGDQSAWAPAVHPDLQRILAEAHDDARSGRQADALAKYVWFHRNALKYEPAMYGVRLSFALSAWEELAQGYEPARQALEDARREAREGIRRRGQAHASFHDFVAINEVVGKEEETAEEFRRIGAADPSLASQLFELARPSLVRAHEYALCGKYLRPHETLARAIEAYRLQRKWAKDGTVPDTAGFAGQALTHETATLVALLVVNGRVQQAEEIATEAKAVWDDSTFHAAIDSAREGLVPEPWP